MIHVYRLSSARFPVNSGTGAALYGGRWNPVGIEAIYAAASRSLAALEVLVHFAVVPLDFVLTEITIPDSLAVLSIDASTLPAAWDDLHVSLATQQIGEQWANEKRYVALSVPSSIIREERNYLLNPEHPRFGEIRFSAPVPFRFDPRLK